MSKIKKQDTVFVIKGRDKGKKARVLEVLGGSKALVEGINLVTKHKRQTRQDQQSGIVKIEAPIAISNLMIFCKNCNRPCRVGFKISKDGQKSRFCRKCQGVII
jgi:large subunit ribosomal protein L24